jgi:hypothetical protein
MLRGFGTAQVLEPIQPSGVNPAEMLPVRI